MWLSVHSRVTPPKQPSRRKRVAVGVFANLVIVCAPLLFVPDATNGRWLGATIFLIASCLTCGLELAFVSRVSEVLSGPDTYQRCALTGGLLLLLLQWASLVEFSTSSRADAAAISTFGFAICAFGCGMRTAGIRNLRNNFRSDLIKCELVTTGIHASIRHPTEVGLLIASAGMTIILQAFWTALLLLPMCWMMARLRIATEEQWLREQHADVYANYCRQTHSWLRVKT